MLADLVDIARHFRQPRQTAGQQDFVAAFQREVGDDADEVGVAAAFADAVDRSLHLRRAAAPPPPASWPRPRRNRCGNGCPARRAELPAPPRRASAISSGRVPPLVSHRMTTDGSGVLGRAQRLQGIFGIVPVAVEKMLGIVKDLAARAAGNRPPNRRSCAGSLPA